MCFFVSVCLLVVVFFFGVFQVLKCLHFLEIKDTRENSVIPWETPRVVLRKDTYKAPYRNGLKPITFKYSISTANLSQMPFHFQIRSYPRS